MRLMNVGERGRERAAMMDQDGVLRDVSQYIRRVGGGSLLPATMDRLRALDPATLPPIGVEARIGPCVLDVPDFLCVGLNYAKHARESGMEPPAQPIIFSKASSALAGPDDDLILPRHAIKADWEVELGVVIGTEAYQLSEATALDHVAGYCLVNDISERSWQLETAGHWIVGKSGPGFGPVGPWLLSAEEVADPQDIDLWTDLNGERMQASNTSDMIFGVVEILVWLSRHMVLRPGTVIATGTPEGVGMGFRPQRFLRDGDQLRLGAAGLGEQGQRVIQA
ncbi:fumarylacetoacetate hydrolase family protein [Pontivivens insulae]|uniref:Ureidoglycolate lyase n=1 Tax=Pontivivens insulae TaxID=1639689 RepID=A0A2R8A701_9RHOB|nr:fumarylacetoacetate hydrolase family protein [Pontivivens insulae]RED17898.1 2-keto-4-pentenoate hydratase/2-oxohepta-3-ene-1,7-dioic acid hydratase in catechol pathway [Pontivivens insulae]SPF27788.1 Ureidoglycolate lyase [Pontivivens insulae]